MKYNLTCFLILLGFIACTNNQEDKSISKESRYLDSLYNVSFLRNMKAISLADSLKSDSFLISNRYVLNGIQNINVFDKLEEATKLNKPLLIYFTAFGGVVCREMEQTILDDKGIGKLIEDEFVFVELTVDAKNKLPRNHQIDHPSNKGRTKHKRPLKTIGEMNSYFQIIVSRTGTQPVFIALDNKRKLGTLDTRPNKERFKLFLENIIKKYHLRNS